MVVLKIFYSVFFFRGEKYMGMWESDSRHGPGLLVTLDGIYNQGNFLQNKLMVCTYFTQVHGRDYIPNCCFNDRCLEHNKLRGYLSRMCVVQFHIRNGIWYRI